MPSTGAAAVTEECMRAILCRLGGELWLVFEALAQLSSYRWSSGHGGDGCAKVGPTWERIGEGGPPPGADLTGRRPPEPSTAEVFREAIRIGVVRRVERRRRDGELTNSARRAAVLLLSTLYPLDSDYRIAKTINVSSHTVQKHRQKKMQPAVKSPDSGVVEPNADDLAAAA